MENGNKGGGGGGRVAFKFQIDLYATSQTILQRRSMYINIAGAGILQIIKAILTARQKQIM